MTDAASSLFSPEGVELRDPAQVERALADMWKPAAQAAGAAGSEPVTRVCLANLVVVAAQDNWHGLLHDLSELSSVYPTRTIVLLLGAAGADTGGLAGAPGGEVRASVSALCHVQRRGRPQICSEQIILRSPLAGACDLDRTLLSMLEADVPTITWWTLDPAHCASLFDGLERLSDRLVLDTELAGLSALCPPEENGGHVRPVQHAPGRTGGHAGCAIRELGWVRTYRMRQFITGMFDECGGQPLAALDEMSIELEAPALADRIDALWIIAFLAGQLDWRPSRRAAESAWEFQAGERVIPVSVRSRSGPSRGIRAVHLRSGSSTFDIDRCDGRSDEYRTIVCDAHACRMPRSVQVPLLPRSDAMAAAMRGRPVDLAFGRAAPIIRWLAGV
jgi:hypothetical protein